MRLSDDFDDRHSGVPVIYMAIGMFLFVITVVGAADMCPSAALPG